MSAFIHQTWTSSPKTNLKVEGFSLKHFPTNHPIFPTFFSGARINKYIYNIYIYKWTSWPPQTSPVGKHTFHKIQGAGWIPNEPVLYQCPGNSFQIFQLRHRAWPFFCTPPGFICDKFEPTKCCSSLLGTLNSNINADSMQFLVRKNRSYVHSHEK